MDKFTIKSNSCGYYIGINNNIVNTDNTIAYEIGINTKEYRNILRNEFNGLTDSTNRHEIFFNDISDIIKALEWVESMYILHKLGGNNE